MLPRSECNAPFGAIHLTLPWFVTVKISLMFSRLLLTRIMGIFPLSAAHKLFIYVEDRRIYLIK
ncbi:hypothetical protein NTGHW29_430003 [Candidatus Nitrotoga sp. HW29]|nr:hypothetical protein NTGHW29_430003 [Candidatus Nitrotoga sp. HW29]